MTLPPFQPVSEQARPPGDASAEIDTPRIGGRCHACLSILQHGLHFRNALVRHMPHECRQPGNRTSVLAGKRVGAYKLDYLLLLLIVVVYLVADAVGEYVGLGALSTVSMVLLVVYAGLSMFLFSKGMTIGKKLLGVRAVKEDGQRAGLLTMLIREWIGKLVSALVLSLGVCVDP